MNNRKGLTLAELLVSLTILLLVMGTAYTIIISTQRASLSEGRKMDTHQAARVTQQILSDSLKGAGAILTMAHTPTFVGASVPFTGIYPLNNANYPDGIILSQGDGSGVTKLTSTFNPGSTLINVISVNDPDNPAKVAWKEGDFGMVIAQNGYYVFRVTQTPPVGSTTLTIRQTPAYYSGLLNTAHYNDLTEEQNGGQTGNAINYPANSPVIRLEYFQIYLVRTEPDGTRTLTLTTDCQGVADVLAAPATPDRNIPLLPNIQDLQIDFITKDTPPVLWAGSDPNPAFNNRFPNPCNNGLDPTGINCRNFYNQFVDRNLFSARVSILAQTEIELEKSATTGYIFSKPPMGDAPAQTLPLTRTHYRLYQFEVLLRNFSIVY